MSEDNIHEEEENDLPQPDDSGEANIGHIIPVSGMYKDWFLDYASYVILERAVPASLDGLKPVQRRLLHSMKDLDDGRYNKVANIIGHTMKYHPHGDASIGDALVQLGQKDIMIDCQGNWGNTLTGDGAAAPRYIEARLSKFALEIAFNPKTTEWQSSYDGRNKEPVHLPVKFPLLLAQGAEGIAVGLACKILPHNFIELIDGSIDLLKGRKPRIYPDFQNGGMADFSNYNDGLRGGRVRVRAKIKELDKKTLVINEIPFGANTGSLIETIVKAADKGKIKVRKIEDNTADKAEILIHLPPGTSPDKTIDALYAFTDCEISISPNACVIFDDKPEFIGVTEMLRRSTERTVALLKMELEIKRAELLEQWHFSSLEKIFIENRIYRDIEEEETWEGVIAAIDKGLKPYTKHLKRAVTEDDITRLTEIKIKRISKFDSFKADEIIRKLEDGIAEVNHHLDNLIEFAIAYYKNLKDKFGKGRERRTEIKAFDNIEATKVIVANKKLYVDRAEGFAGWGMRKDEYVCDCSEIDDVIVFKRDGTMMVTRIDNKKFVGKDIIHIDVWKKDDDRTIYHMVYQDGPRGATMIKRFAVNSITRDKDYDLTKGTKDSQVLYFSHNPNGEAEVITVKLRPRPNLKKLKFDFDFSELAIKGRNANGNTLTKHIVSKIELKEKGTSTLSARKIWFDDVVNRLNVDGRGQYLGEFAGNDRILTISSKGYYKLTGFDLSTHFDEDLIVLEKWVHLKPVSAVYFDGEKEQYYVKRFLVEKSDKPFTFISEHENSILEIATLQHAPVINIQFDKRSSDRESEQVNLREFIAVKGVNAIGNKLTTHKVKSIDLAEPDEDLEAEFEDALQQEMALLKAQQSPEAPIDEVNVSEESGQNHVSDVVEAIDFIEESEIEADNESNQEFIESTEIEDETIEKTVEEGPVIIELSVEEELPVKPLAKPKKPKKSDPDDGGGQITLF
jgi:topoisomerase IV subunit A